MTIFSFRWTRKLFKTNQFLDVDLSELSNSCNHKNIQISNRYLLVDCEVYPRRKLEEFGNSYWDSSDLVESYGLEKDLTIETSVSFYNRNPLNMLGGLDVKNSHILVSCDGQLFSVLEGSPLYEEMLPKRVLHFWKGSIVKKSDWSDLLTDLSSSRIHLNFPAILVFEKDKKSKIAGCGHLSIYSHIPNLSLLMQFLDSNELI
jgi:hypothetical protein